MGCLLSEADRNSLNLKRINQNHSNMHKLFILPLLLLATIQLPGQVGHDLTLFSENGEKFTLYIHGQAVNDPAASTVA